LAKADQQAWLNSLDRHLARIPAELARERLLALFGFR